MTATRFSLNGLLLGVADIVLLISAVGSLFGEQTVESCARGGLCFCTLLFSLLCNLFELSPSRTLIVSGIFYAWGRWCLFFTDFYEPSVPIRLILALVGVAFTLRVLITPLNIPTRQDASYDLTP